MDRYNAECYLTEGQGGGYPCGSWGESVFELMLHPPPRLADRVYRLMRIYNYADSTHSEQLDAVLGEGTRQAMIQLYHDGQYADWAIRLQPLLLAIPYLLPVIFPELATGLREYALSHEVVP